MAIGRQPTLLIGACALALLLSGCVASVADRVSETPPAIEFVVDDGVVQDGPFASSDGKVLYLTLGGSSSCPTVPTSWEVSGDEATIGFGRTGGPACTADMRFVTYEFDLDDPLKRVTLVGDDSETTIDVEPLP